VGSLPLGTDLMKVALIVLLVAALAGGALALKHERQSS
jgi:hypothetical protein